MVAPDDKTWKWETDDQLMVIWGEIDFSIGPTLRDDLQQAIAQSGGDIKLDLSKVEYLDSTGLAVLIEARRVLASAKRALKITGISDQVDKLFELTQVSALFGLAPAE